MQIKGEPIGGKSLAHPDFEPLWATAEELGTTIMLHVGGGRAQMDTRWIDEEAYAGIPDHGSVHQSERPRARRFHALILGGVLERHPGLNVVVAELGYEWVTHFGSRLDRAVADQKPTGAFEHLKLTPTEYFQRQVRVSVLPSRDGGRAGVDGRRPRRDLRLLVGLAAQGGLPNPYEVFEEQLTPIMDDRAKERFYGADLAELLGV